MKRTEDENLLEERVDRMEDGRHMREDGRHISIHVVPSAIRWHTLKKMYLNASSTNHASLVYIDVCVSVAFFAVSR